MVSSIQLIDQDLLLRPFSPGDSVDLYCAVRESLSELKPWMSWATDGYSQRTAGDYITIARARWDEHTYYALAITREKEILELIAEEHTSAEIGKMFLISEKTVEKHRKRLMEKLNVRNLAGLVRLAVKYHLVDRDA